ncbi:MAG: bifunctional phosphopantothenoylcysteine decarboxylase/phosphopantothenate--cysteine ligase CoaBC [Bacteroidales bacterium]|jgi:phosphopantothenoylcysteine decarboxylase/phosphopantothenate--cysteine ligase|nr:bifunctional phosphopantothenoylcysteine decarboxylase/phosphopantothenate--cysteine ligase CoaBC [Bacteroidales bacterium]
MSLAGKHIIIGISGGIAAYKTLSLIRLLVKNEAHVKVVVTPNALHFVTKLSLQTLSKNKVYDSVFSEINDYSTEHIALADWADAMVVAPATANSIGKFANGIVDDALSTTFLAFNKPIFIAPAMNTKMYENVAVQNNLQTLMHRGIQIIESPTGELACGVEGKGRMEEPEVILERITSFFLNSQKLKGKKALVTAGPTYEAIDPVRFIGNHSSGLMGICIADELANCGADLTLVCGPSGIKSQNPSVKRIDVVSAEEMFEVCKQTFEQVDIVVCSAAVADYRPRDKVEQKIKKNENNLVLELIKNPDVLRYLGEHKTTNQTLVGFALETENELQNAEYKLKSKHLDLLVLNSLNDQGAGFGHTTNKISLLFPNQSPKLFELKSKTVVAKDIVNEIISLTTSTNL